MRAIVIEKFGGPDSLVYKDLPEPEPLTGQVVIEVKAFGINHAEMHMRRGEWAEAAKVSGTECVGLVKPPPAASSHSVPRLRRGWAASDAPSTAATPNTPGHRYRTLRSSSPICPGPSFLRSRRHMRPPGRASI